jgi:hypothetical protein
MCSISVLLALDWELEFGSTAMCPDGPPPFEGSTQMELCHVANQALLDEYYEERGLREIAEKIDHLRGAMGVTAVRCEYGTDLKGVLEFLEDSVLVDRWRWSN